MTKTSRTKIERFLDWAEKQDRGTFANLRRGFSSGTAHRCWPYISRYCDLRKNHERIVWQTIAAGFATHGSTCETGNFGTTMRRLALEGSSGKPEDALASFDTRFRRLLTCTMATEVCLHLPGIIRAAKNKNNIPINYATLFNDLHYWGERVKLRWAAAYWEEHVTETEKR